MLKNKGSESSSETQIILERLDQIAKSLAFLVIHSEELKDKSNRDLIPILAQVGFDRNFIAQLLNTTPDTVSVRLSQMKAKAKEKTKANIAIVSDGTKS
jgi:CRP-like cAMP-binding protein